MTEPVPVAPIEAVDTEKAVLSAMMQDDRAMAHALSHLRIEEFYDNRHQVNGDVRLEMHLWVAGPPEAGCK